jgi:hypothetical protein
VHPIGQETHQIAPIALQRRFNLPLNCQLG